MQSIKNKVVLITGGSKGIGLGVAEALVHQYAKVAITSRTQAAADKAAAHLNKIGKGEVMAVAADVCDPLAQQRAVEQVIAKWGRLDVLVANAGLGYFGSVDTLTIEQWKKTIDTNLSGVFYSLKASVQALKESQGYIITIASLAGTNFFEGGSAYNASKFGLVGFTQAAMLDLRKFGIKVATMMPGSVSTEFNDHIPSAKDAWKIQPEDIGQLVVDLLEMNPRTLPSKIEVRPSMPGGK
ncbi:MAG: SDR family oxidoreductase [Flammeovirgaceae bacterium]|nr:SDR family oxidoreductase [Flammeovirgaceae bacterium]